MPALTRLGLWVERFHAELNGTRAHFGAHCRNALDPILTSFGAGCPGQGTCPSCNRLTHPTTTDSLKNQRICFNERSVASRHEEGCP